MSQLTWIDRLTRAAVALVLVVIVTFLLLHIVPGDPARAILGPQATPESVAALRDQLGLDRPLLQQFVDYVAGLLSGDLGTSVARRVPVTELLVDRVPPTLLLILLAAILTIAITVPLAALAASLRGSVVDHVIRILPLLGLGLPAFWLALLLIQYLAVQARLFPVGGYGGSPWDMLRSLVLPAIVIAVSILPFTIQSLRVSMVEVFQADFVAAARARGVPKRSVNVHYVLRNAAVPTVVVLGLNVGWLIGNTLIVEKVFAIPGLGSLLIDSTLSRDFPVVQGLALVIAVLVIITNIVTDAARPVLDPRLRSTSVATR